MSRRISVGSTRVYIVVENGTDETVLVTTDSETADHVAETGNMTYSDFMRRVLQAFPDASVEQDNDGQLCIYTNMTLGDPHPVPGATPVLPMD